MTIQNIEDVMERIMSLNRNLNEESLKTLLSASGWDREDILEGLRIFRATNKSTVAVSPIVSREVTPEEIEQNLSKEAVTEDIVQEKPYSFNLKRKDEEEASKAEIKQVPDNASTKSPMVAVDISLTGKEKVLEKAEETAAEVESFMNGGEDAPTVAIVTTESTEKTNKKKSGRRGGIILLLLLLLLLLGVAATYLFLPSFAAWVNEKLSFGPRQNMVIQDINRVPTPQVQNPSTDTNSPEIPNGTLVIPTQDGNQTHQVVPVHVAGVSDVQVRELMQEIEKLKSDLNSYKNSIPEAKTQTIVRYVSQKGPAGAAGRGILSVGATTTGFVVNYTDNSNEIVPYSTSTLLDVLNSQQVCFRDMNATTSSSTDACLDKNTVLNLLNR